MSDHNNAKHPYHLVDPSPWPLLGSISAGIMAMGIVQYMHSDKSILFIIGTIGVLATMLFWWKDVLNESVVQKAHSAVVKHGFRYGMGLFIASEVMFFFAFFWAFFNASLFPTEIIGSVWPPKDITTIDAFGLPFFNTLLLLLSGTTVTWAHHAIIHNDRKGALQALALTVIIALLFLAVQMLEYSHAPFAFSDGIYPSTFYMSTGFHGFHVFVGTIFLAVCLWRTQKRHFTSKSHFGFEAAAWYWHFVDVVWLFLFVCVYWLGGN
jgi:cytochrome c oxidase subunit 3